MGRPRLELPTVGALTDNSIEVLQDLTQLDRFRVTSLGRLRECPARWQAEMTGQGVKGKPGKMDYAAIGTAVHHACEATLSGQLDPSSSEAWACWDSRLLAVGCKPEERENARAYCEGLRSEWLNNPDREVDAIEYEILHTMLPGLLPLVAHLDLVGFDSKAGCFVIRDHKTNRQWEPAEVWADQIQPKCYTYLMRQLIGYEYPIRYEIGYVNLNSVVSWITDPQEDRLTLQLFCQIMEEFRTYLRFDEFPARVNQWCGTCPLFADCAKAKEVVSSFAALADPTLADGKATGGDTSLMARYAYAKQISELAAATLEFLREELRLTLADAEGAELTEGGFKATLTARKTKEAQFTKVYEAVLLWLKERPGLGPPFEPLMRDLDSVFSVRLTGLSAFAKDKPELAASLVGLITERYDGPSLTVRRTKEK